MGPSFKPTAPGEDPDWPVSTLQVEQVEKEEICKRCRKRTARRTGRYKGFCTYCINGSKCGGRNTLNEQLHFLRTSPYVPRPRK